jgi:hypothetical protein
VLALAEVFTVSGHAAPPSGYRKAKLLSGGYREKLISALREPEIEGENGTGLVNINVKVIFFTTSRCLRRRQATSGTAGLTTNRRPRVPQLK